MATVPRAKQVLMSQVAVRPERYPSYHKDLIEILNAAIRAISDSAEKNKRRRDLADAIKAKASQIPSTEGGQ